MSMDLQKDRLSAPGMNLIDRRIIRVDVTPTHAGIMAALRRAFEAAAAEPCDRDFGDLLRRLN
jgi:hypothetical protein